MANLFATDDRKHNAILLVDSSGSTVYNKFQDVDVFDYMLNLAKGLPETSFRVLFWNSDKNAQPHFNGGVFKILTMVEQSKLGQPFTIAKSYITQACFTSPHVAFDNIPPEWIPKDAVTKIYYLSDGQMGWSNISYYDKNQLKSNLANSIKRLFSQHPTVQLHMITVQPEQLDFTQMETLKTAAGCDVYQVIMDNQLTKYVTKFISYTLNNLNGFVHISKNIPPPGHVPFGDQYFSELRTHEFVEYLSKLIKETPAENDLLKIVQNLSSTLCLLTKDKPQYLIHQIVRTFCDLFGETVIDPMFVQFILTDAIEKENAGQANVFAAYRAQMKELFKMATELLLKNTKDAIGLGDRFLSLPTNGKLITGHYRLVDRNIHSEGRVYPQAALEINGVLVPVIPFDYTRQSQMNEQCVRQWVRVLVAKMYGVSALDDSIIYIVLAMVLQVVVSDVDEAVKNSYRRLGTIMLQKKRLNSNTTELARLVEGNIPSSNNGKIEDFIGYMNRCKQILGVDVKPMTLWYAMCHALGNAELAAKQYFHCRDDVKTDCSSDNLEDLMVMLGAKIPKLTYHKIPFQNVLEYTCPVTLDDTSRTGGYTYLPHQNSMDQTCCPVVVLSEAGYKAMMARPESCLCPGCYTRLNASQFEQVDPKPAASVLKIFEAGASNIFASSSDAGSSIAPQPRFTSSYSASQSSGPVSSNGLNKKGTLVMPKATTGGGKSLWAAKVKIAIEALGGRCIVVGIDEFCKNGMSFQEAFSCAQQKIRKLNDFPDDGKLLVVIVDTCNEKDYGNDVFGIDFTGWKRIEYWPNLIKANLTGYLCWSLRNVLLRQQPGPNDSHWLNPRGAGCEKCIEIHMNKARALFPGKGRIPKLPVNQNMNDQNEAIRLLTDQADAYQRELDLKMNLDAEVEKFVAGLFA